MYFGGVAQGILNAMDSQRAQAQQQQDIAAQQQQMQLRQLQLEQARAAQAQQQQNAQVAPYAYAGGQANNAPPGPPAPAPAPGQASVPMGPPTAAPGGMPPPQAPSQPMMQPPPPPPPPYQSVQQASAQKQQSAPPAPAAGGMAPPPVPGSGNLAGLTPQQQHEQFLKTGKPLIDGSAYAERNKRLQAAQTEYPRATDPVRKAALANEIQQLGGSVPGGSAASPMQAPQAPQSGGAMAPPGLAPEAAQIVKIAQSPPVFDQMVQEIIQRAAQQGVTVKPEDAARYVASDPTAQFRLQSLEAQRKQAIQTFEYAQDKGRQATMDALNERRENRLETQSVTASNRQEAHELEMERHNRATEGLGQQRVDKPAAGGLDANGLPKGTTPDGIRAETYSYLINNVSPPKRTGEYSAVMSDIAKLAKENGMSTEELISSGADVKTQVMAKRQFEVRTQNLLRAENQLGLEIPVMKDAMDKLNPSNFPGLAKMEISAIRQGAGTKEQMELVTKLDQAATTVFNEFEGIVTGNPGTLNVGDVQKAKESYENAKTPVQMNAAIQGMERIIENAKKANNQTRKEIMGNVRASIDGKNTSSGSAPANTNAKGWTLHADKNGNKAYVSPDGKQYEEVK